MTSILLYSQSNPLAPVMSLMGFAIAMIFVFTRQGKKDKKEREKLDDEKNKMK